MQQLSKEIQFLRPVPAKPDLPLLIFLPGLDGTGLLLRSQIPHLSKTFDICCLSIPHDDISSWEGLATETIAAIARVRGKLTRPVYLCGESFGGCLALQVALKAPQIWERLILINPASCFPQQPLVNLSPYLTRLLPKNIYPLSSLWLLPFLGALERMLPGDRQALLDAMRSVPQRTSIWRLELLRSFHLQPTELARLERNVLLIASAGDRLLHSVSHARFLTNHIPKAKMVVLPESGHACLLEKEVNLYNILKKHWGSFNKEGNLKRGIL